MFNPGADVYYEKSFRDALEANMDNLRQSNRTQTLGIDSHKAVVYQGDLFGYLLSIGIPPQYHWAVMRINRFNSPFQFGPETDFIVIPEYGEIDKLRQIQKTNISIRV